MNVRMAIRGAIGVAVSVASVLLLLGTIDLHAVAARISAIEPGWLAIAPVSLAVQLGLRSMRWALLLTATTHIGVRTIRVIGPLTVGYLANALLPARLGEVARSVLVARREAIAFGAVVASVVVERVLDLAALLVVGLAITGVAGIGWLAVAITGALLAGLMALIGLAPAIMVRLDRFAPTVIRASLRDFLAGIVGVGLRASSLALVLSAVAWFGDVALMWAAARSLGIDLPLSAAVAIAVGAALGTALPAASGYLGTYEVGAVALGSFAGTAPDTVLAIAIVAHVFAVVPVALLGAITVASSGLPLSRTRDDPAGPRKASA